MPSTTSVLRRRQARRALARKGTQRTLRGFAGAGLTPSPSPALRERGELAEIEREIDEAAAELWGISAAEMEEIRRSLEELG
jgi:hypothetical protein